jgi:1,3-beta-glucan synthase
VNYRKWYIAARLDLDDAVGHTQNPGIQRLRSERGGGRDHYEKSLTSALERWRQAMNNMSQYDRTRQIPLLSSAIPIHARVPLLYFRMH